MSDANKAALMEAAMDFSEWQRMVNTYLERTGGVPKNLIESFTSSKGRLYQAARELAKEERGDFPHEEFATTLAHAQTAAIKTSDCVCDFNTTLFHHKQDCPQRSDDETEQERIAKWQNLAQWDLLPHDPCPLCRGVPMDGEHKASCWIADKWDLKFEPVPGEKTDYSSDPRAAFMDENTMRFADKALEARAAGFAFACLGCGCGLTIENEDHECSREFLV